jgi:large subunit ribosomal protein L25
METGELVCEKRETKPKGFVNQLRRAGRVPAVLYGPKTATTALSVSAADLQARIAHAAQSRIIRLKSNSPDLEGKHVILKEVQRAPVSRELLHADLYEVDLSRTIRVSVALKFVGRPAGVALGGIMQPLERGVEVECLPLEIPEAIEVDVTELGVHDVVHVSALKFAGNVKPIYETDYPVVTVLPPTVAEAPAAAAPAEGEAAEAAAAPAEGAAAPAAGAAKESGGAGAAGAAKKA